MNSLTVAAVLCLCLSSSFATYGPDHNHHGHNDKPHYDSHKVEPKIHLDSPKIILNRPSINVHEPSSLHEDEPIILAHDKPLYIRKTLHGIPSGSIVNAAHAAPVPILLGGGYSHGKVLDITAPIQVINHAPIVEERPILIRRPVVVSKSLSGTQDQLEKLHYAHSGLIHSGGYSHGGYAHGGYAHGEFAVPVSKALHERTLVYGGLTHGYGGHIAPAYYNAPLLVEQPKAILLGQSKAYGHGHSGIGIIGGGHLSGHGGHLHSNGGHLHAASLKKY